MDTSQKHTGLQTLRAFAAGAIALLLCGCTGSGETDVDTSRAAEFGFQTSVRTSLIEEGRSVRHVLPGLSRA